MTIVEFLEARLTEDEASLRDRLPGDDVDSRGLREVGAKRAIVRQALVWIDDEPDGTHSLAMAQTCYGDVLRALAAVYADHPDYDQAWAAVEAVR